MSKNGKYVQGLMTFHFGRSGEEWIDFKRQAMIHVSLDNDFPGVIRADVDIDSLPLQRNGGNEVLAVFELKNFINDGVFYTDSNGMEMQKRILNYRPTWDINNNYRDSNENVTANFYPINSAISMTYKEKKFTVMNDRSQAGSALENGQIMFLQHRREFEDDGRGEGDELNELDKNGHGIRVKATYYLDISSINDSRQRQVQQKTDNPLQQFFSLKLESTD